MGRPSEPFGDRIRSRPVTVGAMTVASTGVDITAGASPAPMRKAGEATGDERIDLLTGGKFLVIDHVPSGSIINYEVTGKPRIERKPHRLLLGGGWRKNVADCIKPQPRRSS